MPWMLPTPAPLSSVPTLHWVCFVGFLVSSVPLLFFLALIPSLSTLIWPLAP